MIVYTLFILGQALAQNMQTLLVTRFLSGFFAVAPVNNAGGMWYLERSVTSQLTFFARPHR